MFMASFHPHCAHGRVLFHIRSAHGKIIFTGLVQRAIEYARAPGHVVGSELASGIEIAMYVPASQLLQSAQRMFGIISDAH